MQEIKQVLVVGSGAMGSQIAMVSALAGYQVSLVDIDEAAIARADQTLHTLMEARIAKGRLTREAVADGFGRLALTTDLANAARTADLVIEAVVEKLDVKRSLFAQLDEFCPPHAILATNSSTIVSSRLADATRRPAQICNIHFFNPALVMQLVEIVRNPETSDDTVNQAVAYAEHIGKTPVVLNKEISGFIANRILGKLMDEAVYLYEEGIASFEDIDLAVTKGLNHPIGPFALMDLTGIDINYLVRAQRFQETGDEADRPRPSITKKYERGEFGRKTGKGWYDYPTK